MGGNKAIAASTIGLTMLVTILIFWRIGVWLDGKLGYKDLFSLLGIIGGTIGGLYQMIRMLISITKDDK